MSNELLNRLGSYSTCQAADAFDKLKIRGHMPDIILLSPDSDYRMVGEAHTVRRFRPAADLCPNAKCTTSTRRPRGASSSSASRPG